jgi:hypothetical protein
MTRLFHSNPTNLNLTPYIDAIDTDLETLRGTRRALLSLVDVIETKMIHLGDEMQRTSEVRQLWKATKYTYSPE